MWRCSICKLQYNTLLCCLKCPNSYCNICYLKHLERASIISCPCTNTLVCSYGACKICVALGCKTNARTDLKLLCSLHHKQCQQNLQRHLRLMQEGNSFSRIIVHLASLLHLTFNENSYPMQLFNHYVRTHLIENDPSVYFEYNKYRWIVYVLNDVFKKTPLNKYKFPLSPEELPLYITPETSAKISSILKQYSYTPRSCLVIQHNICFHTANLKFTQHQFMRYLKEVGEYGVLLSEILKNGWPYHIIEESRHKGNVVLYEEKIFHKDYIYLP